MEIEWRGRADFARFAEALEIPTDQVLSAGSSFLITYTPEKLGSVPEDELEVRVAAVAPDPKDAILRVVRDWHLCTWGEFKAEAAKLIGLADDDPANGGELDWSDDA